MKFKSFLIFISVVLFCYSTAQSGNFDEVTLTVSSNGPSKDEATKNALRSAIEQAYGAFVSANTTIINDELVKDEIVTVSNGSIKEYREMVSNQLPDGTYSVTLKTTVSLPHLIQYAKSHGSECEFAGNTFNMQMKLTELQIKNERKALDNILKQLEVIVPKVMIHELQISEPVLKGDNYMVDATVSWHEGYDYTSDQEYLLNAVGLTLEDYDNIMSKIKNGDVMRYLSKNYKNKNQKELKTIERVLGGVKSMQSGRKRYDRHLMSQLDIFMLKNLCPLSISDEEFKWLRDHGFNPHSLDLRDKDFGAMYDDILPKKYILLRDRKNIDYFKEKRDSIFEKNRFGFVIKDNTGQISDPKLLTESEYNYYFKHRFAESTKALPNYTNFKNTKQEYGTGEFNRWHGSSCVGTGLFYPYYHFINTFYETTGERFIREEGDTFEFTLYIPKEDIGKYSKFWVEPTD